ncbi:putative RNA recognition motif domain, nucleotide-binding alpha-beta plait domain superfamily [Helianthus annuus]|nr:putative RNA recognition motif domain, nucleotide-binding alpha-beta plait domain superfamily [Helianthus annuus]
MRPPFKSNNTIGNKNLTDSSPSDTMFSNLWVGNLTPDVTELDLRNLFEKHGVVDSVTCYPARSYAFVNMRRPEDAKRAKDSLQAVVLRGGSLKIDFAKPARPCKTLWVSGINMSTSKEDMEQEFSKFGKIEDFRFIRDKNTAYIDYARLEDASKALKMMNGKYKGGSVLRVDYLRSQSKRDPGHDFRDVKEGQYFRSMVPLDSPWLPPDAVNPSYNGAKRQQHNMPLEGNEDQPSNVLVISYPPVVHVDEQMLHNAMILFGEIDNITSFPSRNYSLVEFRSVEEAQLAKDGLRGRLFNDPRISIMFLNNEHAPNNDISGFHHPGTKPHGMFNEFPPPGPPMDAYGHPVLMPARPPFGPPDSFDPLLQGPEFNPMGVPNWRSPGPTRTSPGTWDVFDASQLHREPKRLRTGGNTPLREMKDQGVLGPDPAYGGPTKFPTRGAEKGRPGSDYIWRGVIAKGGTPVCNARCVPIREWVGYDIPEVVNCSARTGLDMLAKHYTDAVGFDIVFFLPDSEEDFASYTEFVRYLGDRNRAGVAKFDDGTTLFLVPPSEFLSEVLNVSGPERLYGVVLKFPQHASASSSQPQFIDKQQVPSQNEYNVVPSGEKVLQVDYSGVPHDDLKSNPKSTGPSHNPLAPPPPAVSTPTPQTGLALTPELIATLASLAKGNFNDQQPSAAGPPNERPPWEYEPELSNNTFHGQPPILPGHQGYQSNMVNNAHLTASGNFPPMQDYSFGMPQHDAVPSPMPQSGQFAVPVQPNQQYLPNIPQETHPGSVLQAGANPYGANVYQPQRPENPGMQLPEQMQQLQSALYAAGQPPSDFDADKNERYQSTLQFATNLLLQIHQQQPSGQGSGSGSLP